MKHILICEDSEDIAEVTAQVLRNYGYHVTIFFDCADIAKKAESIMPDLILMDLWMPAQGGDGAVCELKNNPKTQHIPVLIFSAVNDADAIAERCGADGVIRKPYDIAVLDNTIKGYISRTTTAH